MKTSNGMNKTITTVLLILLGSFGLMWWGKSVQKPVSHAPGVAPGIASVLSTPEQSYDFGTIRMANGNVSKVFKVTNPTGKDVNVKSVYTSCMCTAAYIVNGTSKKGPFGMQGMGYVPPADEIIKAGETRDIEVVYDPNAHGPAGVGSIDRFAYLTDENGGTLQLEIKAVVTP